MIQSTGLMMPLQSLLLLAMSLPWVGYAISGICNQTHKVDKIGTVDTPQVPGHRLEKALFKSVLDSGPDIKEGVIEPIRYFNYVKTYSIRW